VVCSNPHLPAERPEARWRDDLIDEMHLAISPVLLGQGEPLFEGIDFQALGYRVKKHVSTEAAMHLVVER